MVQLPMDTMDQTKDIRIIAGKLFDSREGRFIHNQLITVDPLRGIITDVKQLSLQEQDYILQEDKNSIDLSNNVVMPGFVDAHVHLFLHPYTEVSWEDQVTRQSVVERTVRAVTHARKTLLAGFTTVRDLGTEGAEDADISLRKCISGPNPIIAGPRYFVANRAIVTTGSYGPKGAHHMNTEGVEGLTGAVAADGVAECRKEVRRQVGAGADWIKVYGDYSPRSRLGSSSAVLSRQAIATFLPDEIQEMIMTARLLGVKTSIHLKEDNTARLLAIASPNSIEHGQKIGDDKFELMKRHGTFWVPTLSAYYTLDSTGLGLWSEASATFKRALKIDGLKIACGGDTGVFPHGENALELKLMVSLGADPKTVLQWATLHGWQCIRGLQWEGEEGQKRINKLPQLKEDTRITGDNDMPFGVIGKGFAADIIATSLDPEKEFDKAVSATNITFVMKGGRIFKQDGKEVPL
ncbi:hypothetical protein M422DRAFT_201167 [Sphaerobolus stellatus SS14]|nr:hypothetical protein M422DRAFT_201167 [Sphaerobolus stellatus SS14]